ncbi:MAG: hypothetical protein AB9891_12670 [Anaerolineaceae bacterium]
MSLVADYVGDGVIAYWFEPNNEVPVPVPFFVPNLKTLREYGWTPGIPAFQPAIAFDLELICKAGVILLGGAIIGVTISTDVTGIGIFDDPKTIPTG